MNRRVDRLISGIYREMGFADGEEFERFWAAENRRIGRPIPPEEMARRKVLINAAMERVFEREPGEEG